MFASRLTTQLKSFFSWRPDPEAEALDAFNQDWSTLRGRGYANPPLNLVGRVLNRSTARRDHTGSSGSSMEEPTIVSLDMLVDFPVLLPHKKDLIIPTHTESVCQQCSPN